jgi:hypothetical protein
MKSSALRCVPRSPSVKGASAAPASVADPVGDKVTPDDLKALVQLAKANSKSWQEVRNYCVQTFGKAEPNLLTKSELDLLEHDLFEQPAYPF